MSGPATPAQKPAEGVSPYTPPQGAGTPDAGSTDDVQRTKLEDKLEQLLQSLLEVGICTSDVQESALEGVRAGGGQVWGPGGLLGRKINDSIVHMAELDELNQSTSPSIPIPLQVINLIDQGTNPDRWLRDFVDRAAHENMYTNGIMTNIEDYHSMLSAELQRHFPDLRPPASEP